MGWPERVDEKTLHIGFDHMVIQRRIVSIHPWGSKPLVDLKHQAKQECRLIDATNGHKTRAVIFTDTDLMILSANSVDTLRGRLESE